MCLHRVTMFRVLYNPTTRYIDCTLPFQLPKQHRAALKQSPSLLMLFSRKMPPFHIPPVLFILSAFLSSFSVHIFSGSDAADTMSPGQVLAGSDKLVSTNGRFALGFFHTGSSESSYNTSVNWYLGIWFNKVPKLTPVWVANRQNPIIDPTICELILSWDGNLAILNKITKSKVWSSEIENSVASNYTAAVLQNNGNLVIHNATNSSSVLWQSFDYPADALLPGAKLGWNKVTGMKYYLTSNKNSMDLALGSYCFELSTDHQLTQKLCNSSVVYWSSGKWNGKFFPNLPEMAIVAENNGPYHFTVVDNEKEAYYMYTIQDGKSITTFTLMDASGLSKIMMWHEGLEDWLNVYQDPKANCDVYGVCGPFTVCNDNMSPLCTCMKGFSITSSIYWDLGDQTSGCTRNIELDCISSTTNSTDKFYSIPSVRLPSNGHMIDAATNIDHCAQACLSKCTCSAYSYGTRCTIWHNELLNVVKQQQYDNTNNSIIYLRLAAKEVQNWGHHKRTAIIWGSMVAVGILLIFILFLLTIWRIKRKAPSSVLNSVQEGGGLIAFRYNDLRYATKNFLEKLGGGSFGFVFKGCLHCSNVVVAVKRLEGAIQGEKQFRAEVSSIGIIQHINLVKLIGFCCEGNKRLLVYEYMPNGSLDTQLFKKKTNVLDWSTRYQISLGVAKGLAYLHHSCQECIIHCDIKPENILLDASFVPKVADFGMAKLVGRDFSRVLTTVRGTIGYLAPEWISGVAITSKVDVYSYGMVLLEIVSGKRSSKECYTSNGDHSTYFPMHVASKLLEGDVQSLVDLELCGDVNFEEVERICKLACWCIQDNEFDRPTMGQVVQILEGVLELDIPPMPRLIQAIFASSSTT